MCCEVRSIHIDAGAEDDGVPRDGGDVAGEGAWVFVVQSAFRSAYVIQIGEVAGRKQHQLRRERE